MKLTNRAVVATALVAGVAAASAALVVSARLHAAPRTILTVHSLPFDTMMLDPAFDDWFRANLRCSQRTFSLFFEKLRPFIGDDQQKHVAHSPEKKLAVLLYYMGSQCGDREAGSVFGLSKSWAINTTSALIDALCHLAAEIIVWPSSGNAWEEVETAFKNTRAFPGADEAVDGCLFEKQRPRDFEGFYCRKGHPALSAQAIVSAAGRIMSFEVQPGSWSDQKMWNYSSIGRAPWQVLPTGTHLVGYSGYVLVPHLMTPFDDYPYTFLPRDEHRYTFALSSTRIVVERAFGLLKGHFRTLICVMEEKTVDKSVKAIVACAVLHNLFIDYTDDTANENDNSYDNAQNTHDAPRHTSICESVAKDTKSGMR